MSHSQLLNAPVLGFLPDDLGHRVVLDVGCGFGEWGFIIRTRKHGSPFLVGVDVWRPYLERIQSLNIYDELIQVEIPRIPLKKKSIDVSLACEILEHLQKNVGYELMKELEKVTKNMIIVSAPLNIPQEEVHGNPFQRHISEWLPEDFTKFGYETKVIYMLPKTLEVADRIRRLIFFRLSSPRRLIVARKRL